MATLTQNAEKLEACSRNTIVFFLPLFYFLSFFLAFVLSVFRLSFLSVILPFYIVIDRFII